MEERHKAPLISIIVPVYKVEKYLRKCIESILNQTYVHIEAILVDDGSPDACPQICDEYARQDSRVRVLHKKNGGLSDARNAGIEAAKGKYIAFIDGDDFIEKNMMEIMQEALEKYQADIALCGFYCVEENGTRLEAEEEDELPSEGWDYQEFWKHYYENHCVSCAVAWNKLYRRELFAQLRYRVGKLHEDEFMIHQLVKRDTKLAAVPERLYGYLKRSGSITGTGFQVKRLDGVEAQIERCNVMFSEKEWHYAKKTYWLAFCSLTLAREKMNPEDEECREKYQELKKQLYKVFRLAAKKGIVIKQLLASAIYFINEELYWRILEKRRR